MKTRLFESYALNLFVIVFLCFIQSSYGQIATHGVSQLKDSNYDYFNANYSKNYKPVKSGSPYTICRVASCLPCGKGTYPQAAIVTSCRCQICPAMNICCRSFATVV